MFTIEEARISRPATTRQVPHGATVEFSKQDIHRALENQTRNAEQVQRKFLHHHIHQSVRTVISVLTNFSGASQETVVANQSDAQ